MKCRVFYILKPHIGIVYNAVETDAGAGELDYVQPTSHPSNSVSMLQTGNRQQVGPGNEPGVASLADI